MKIKNFQVYRDYKGRKLKELLNVYYEEGYTYFIKDIEGNFYQLNKTAEITLRDIKMFVKGIELVSNKRFERIDYEY